MAPRGYVDAFLSLQRVESSGPASSGAVPTRSPQPAPIADVGVVFGGRNTVISLNTDPTLDGRRISSVRASLRFTGDSVVEELSTSVTDSGLALELPDRDGTGLVAIDIAWTDACFDYEGVAAATVSLASTITVGACPTASDAILASIVGLQRTNIVVGSAHVPISIFEYEARFTSLVAGDVIPSVGSWDPSAVPATGAAGGTLSMHDTSDKVRLGAVQARFYRRGDVLLNPVSSSPGVLSGEDLHPRVNGTISIKLPPRSGPMSLSSRPPGHRLA